MRIRTIKPEFFKHDILGGLPALSRLLYVGLWCMADCAGRLEDRPKRIKVEVLPYDDVNIDEMLAELDKSGLILRYLVENERYIEIPAFSRHQRISGKESDQDSRFPPPQQSKKGKRRGSNGEAPGKHPEPNGEAPGITGNGRETEGKGNDTRKEAFERFWSAYPKKKDRAEAAKAFAKVAVPVEALLAAIDRFKLSDDWKKDGGQFIPYPSKWLNKRRWEDEADLPLAPPKIPPGYAEPYIAPSEIR